VAFQGKSVFGSLVIPATRFPPGAAVASALAAAGLLAAGLLAAGLPAELPHAAARSPTMTAAARSLPRLPCVTCVDP